MLPILFAALCSQPAAEGAVQFRTLSPSGVRIAICPRPEATTVAIAAGFRVGSAFDGAATAGCAHLLEHMILFRGTELSPYGELVEGWRRLGARPNGHTFPDYTVFRVSVQPEHVARALELLREMLLHPAFSQADAAREREVVIAELAPLERDPSYQVYRMAARAVFGEDNYGLPGFGYPRVLAELSTTTLFSRFDEEYGAGRLTIAVAGPVTPEVLVPVFEETFAGYRPGVAAVPDLGELPPLDSQAWLVETSAAQVAQLGFAFRGPPSASKDWLPFAVMAWVLGGGEGSRLWDRLVFQDGIAKHVSLELEPRVRGGFALLRVILEPGDIDRCEREVRRALARTAERPIDPSLVERSMNRLRLEYAHRTEGPQSLAAELVAWDMLGSWTFPLAVRENLASVTIEQLRRIGQLYFAPSKARLVAVVPEGFPYAGEAGPRQAVHRDRQLVSTPFQIAAQSIPNTKVYSFALAVWGGLAGDRPGQEGLGGLVARSILRGGSGGKEEGLLEKLNRWGVEAEAGTKRDYTFIKFSAPEGEYEDALYGVSRSVLYPALGDEEGLERTRQEVLAETVTFPSVAQAAERRLWRKAFGGTPYQVVPPGTTEAMEGLKHHLRAKATRHWEAWWRPENFAVAVSGPRQAGELVQLVQRAFEPVGQYQRGARPPIAFELPLSKPQVEIVDHEIGQAFLLHAWFAQESTLDTLVAFLLLREVLVGGPGTRLWPLRQEEGLLYHLGGKVVVARKVIGLELSMILPFDKVRAGTEVLGRELGSLLASPIDPGELDLARLALRQQDEDRREQGLSLVEEEAWFLMAGWTRESYLERLGDETPPSFREKLRRFFGRSSMWTVAVGPEDVLRPQLGH